MEPEFVDEERIPLLERQDVDDDIEYQETSFNNDDDEIIQREKNIENIDTQINALERNFNIDIPSEERGRFRLVNGYLQVERSPGEYTNVTKANGEFLAASTLRSRLGSSLARSLLGIETPTSLKSRSRILFQDLPTEIEMSDITIDKLGDIIEETTKSIGTNTDLDMREFLGIDKALTRIKGELVNNASKLTEIDKHLEKEYKKLKEAEKSSDISDEMREKIKSRISNLKEERSGRLEIISQNKKELASQFSRIRQTVEKILDEDLTLREKIKLVFREHGLTITAVLTAFGLIISTIITSLTGSTSGGSSTPPKNPNKVKEWLKGKLKALARLLGRLAEKAAAALPGVIGSIVAAVLNFLKKVVTTASEHVWLFITSIATLIFYHLFQPSPAAPLGTPKDKKRQPTKR